MTMGMPPVPPDGPHFNPPTANMEPDNTTPVPETSASASTVDSIDKMTIGCVKKYVEAYPKLRRDYERVDASLRKSVGENKRLEEGNTILKKENDRLKRANDDLQTGKTTLQGRMGAAKQEITQKSKEVAFLRTSLEMVRSESLDEIHQVKARNATLQHQLDDAASAKDECTLYLRKIEDLEKVLAGKNSLLSSQQIEKERLRKEASEHLMQMETAYLLKIESVKQDLVGKNTLLSSKLAEDDHSVKLLSEHLQKLGAERDELARQTRLISSEESQYLAAWHEMKDSRDYAEHCSYDFAMQLAKAKDECDQTQAALSRALKQIAVAERQIACSKQEACNTSKAAEESSKNGRWLDDAYKSNKAVLNAELIKNGKLIETLRDCQDRAFREKNDYAAERCRLVEDGTRCQRLLDQKRQAFDTLRLDYEKLRERVAGHASSGELNAETITGTHTKKRKRPPTDGFRAGDANLTTEDQPGRGNIEDTGPNAESIDREEQVALRDPRLEKADHERNGASQVCRQDMQRAQHRKRYIGSDELKEPPTADALPLIRKLHDRYKDIEVLIGGRALQRGFILFVEEAKMHEIMEVGQHITEKVEEVDGAIEVENMTERLWILAPHNDRPWVQIPGKGLVQPSTIAEAATISVHEQSQKATDAPTSPEKRAGGQLSVKVRSAGTDNAELQTPASPIIDSALDPVTRAEASSSVTRTDTHNALWRQWDDDEQDIDGKTLRRLHREEQSKAKLHSVDRYVSEERSGSFFVSPQAPEGACTPNAVEGAKTAPCPESSMNPDRSALVGPQGPLRTSDEEGSYRERFKPPRGPRRLSSAAPTAYREDLRQPYVSVSAHARPPKRAWLDEQVDPRMHAASKRGRRSVRPEYDAYRPVRD